MDVPGHACICNLRLDADPDSPCSLFLQLGAEQQVGEEEDVTEFPGTFHQLHHKAIPQELTVLPKETRDQCVQSMSHLNQYTYPAAG